MKDTMTPKELAVRLWGADQDWARSAGARRVRSIARRLYPERAPGQGGEWALTHEQARRIEVEARR